MVLGYIEEGLPKTDFKKMNRSNHSREEGEKEVEIEGMKVIKVLGAKQKVIPLRPQIQ